MARVQEVGAAVIVMNSNSEVYCHSITQFRIYQYYPKCSLLATRFMSHPIIRGFFSQAHGGAGGGGGLLHLLLSIQSEHGVHSI